MPNDTKDMKLIIPYNEYDILTVDLVGNMTQRYIDGSSKSRDIKSNCFVSAMVIDNNGKIYCGDAWGRIFEVNLFTENFQEEFKDSNTFIYTLKLLLDGNLLVSGQADNMYILSPMRECIVQSLNIENFCRINILDVLSNGSIIIGCYKGGITILEFSTRQLVLSDLHHLLDALEKNSFVKILNLNNVTTDDKPNFRLDSLKKERKDIDIIGLPKAR